MSNPPDRVLDTGLQPFGSNGVGGGMQRIERPRSLTELVADALRREIVEGELQLGAALSEARIAQRLEVSRTPVREAFTRLEREGLLRTEPQRGTFVFTLSAKELTDICHLRVVLEIAA